MGYYHLRLYILSLLIVIHISQATWKIGKGCEIWHRVVGESAY